MRTSVGVGSSDSRNPVEAGNEAALKALERAGISRPDFVFAFATVGYNQAAVPKATGLNVLRAVAFKNRLRRQEKAKKRSDVSKSRLIAAVNERLLRVYDNLLGTVLGVAINCHRMCGLTPQVAW